MLIFSVQSIAAAEISDAGASDNIFDLSNDIQSVDADNPNEVVGLSDSSVSQDEEVIAAPSSDDVVSEGGNTFTDLEKMINESTTGSLTLDKDYVFSDGDADTGIAINKSIVIDGAGYTIDAQQSARIFNILAKAASPKHTITLKNLNLVNGVADNGGAINVGRYNELNVDNCNITNNTANNRGGAIYSPTAESNVNIIRSDFRNNRAISENGGALYGFDYVINMSEFYNNSAKNGGVIYRAGGNFNISNTNFINNSASESGGVVYTTRTSSPNSDCIRFTNCNLEYNNATNGNGEAVYLKGSSSGGPTVRFNNTNVIGNLAKSDSGWGGAVYSDNGRIFAYGSSQFIGNNATTGSAIYMASQSGQGYLYLELNGTVILDNQANSTALPMDASGDLESGENVVFNITFTGKDNLFNGIYTLFFIII